jgi:hypothetical protein
LPSGGLIAAKPDFADLYSDPSSSPRAFKRISHGFQ